MKQTARANNTYFIKQLVLTGQGIAFLPCFTVKDEWAKGEIKLLFDCQTARAMNVFALYPERQFTPPKVLKFI